MKFSVSAPVVESLATAFGETDLLRGLKAHRYHASLERLITLTRRISKDEANEVFSIVDNGFCRLREMPSHIQQMILGYPSFPIWLKAMESLALSDNSGRDCALQLNRFVLAGTLAVGNGHLRCLVPVDPNNRVFFPGTHSYLQLAPHETGNFVTVTVSDGNVNEIYDQKVLDSWSCERIPTCDSGFEINSLDEDFRHLLPEFAFADLDGSGEVAWRNELDSAFDFIAATSPSLAEELRYIRVIVPLVPPEPTVNVSGTPPAVSGIAYLSWTATVSEMVETVIHEYHHQKLGLLVDIDPLFLRDDGMPRFYSPWKAEPRPLLGILHGAYVFGAVCKFWSCYFATASGHLPLIFAARTHRRAYFLSLQVRSAIAVLLEAGSFTAIGQALLSALERDISRCAAPPSCSEERRQAMENLLSQHLSQWIVKYGGGAKTECPST